MVDKTIDDFSDDLEHVFEVLPNASMGEDNYGQIIIYTNLTMSDDGEHVVEWKPEDA